MLQKPMTSGELFSKICAILEKQGKMPEMLDYALADDRNSVKVKTYEFSFTNELAYGGNEGIYLDMGITYVDENREWKRVPIGTFKTLGRSSEHMRTMAILLADFIVEGTAYVNANMDDFTWHGTDVNAYDENGVWKAGCTFENPTDNDIEKRKNYYLEKYPVVIVRDNVTREETTYNR